MGHKLFKATSQSFTVPLLAGDIFDKDFIDPSAPLYGEPLSSNIGELSNLKSLRSLRGLVSVVHAAAFFHLFEEEKQLQAARALASLLSPEPGSVVFGSHIATPEPKAFVNMRGEKVFCHFPDSWKELWDGRVFEKGSIVVEVKLTDIELKPRSDEYSILKKFDWSVRRT